jgi:Ser/Thr protein kinase RdoA (MazF antagonist)
MSLGALLAQGRTAEIYEWGPDRVIKLLRQGRDRGEAEHEAQLTRAVREAGFGAPLVEDVIEVDGRAGIVMERLPGVSMYRAMFSSSSPGAVVDHARSLAEIHAEMHRSQGRRLPSQRRRLIEKIRHVEQLTEEKRELILGSMSRLDDGTAVCHGDLHPDNVVHAPGAVRVIDWVDAVSGSPVADVARTLIVLEGATCHEQTAMDRGVFRSVMKRLAEAYLARYLELSPIDPQTLEDWLVPVAAARLCEGVEEEEDYLLTRVEAGLRSS